MQPVGAQLAARDDAQPASLRRRARPPPVDQENLQILLCVGDYAGGYRRAEPESGDITEHRRVAGTRRRRITAVDGFHTVGRAAVSPAARAVSAACERPAATPRLVLPRWPFGARTEKNYARPHQSSRLIGAEWCAELPVRPRRERSGLPDVVRRCSARLIQRRTTRRAMIHRRTRRRASTTGPRSTAMTRARSISRTTRSIRLRSSHLRRAGRPGRPDRGAGGTGPDKSRDADTTAATPASRRPPSPGCPVAPDTEPTQCSPEVLPGRRPRGSGEGHGAASSASPVLLGCPIRSSSRAASEISAQGSSVAQSVPARPSPRQAPHGGEELDLQPQVEATASRLPKPASRASVFRGWFRRECHSFVRPRSRPAFGGRDHGRAVASSASGEQGPVRPSRRCE
jgi:hypothetical protein